MATLQVKRGDTLTLTGARTDSAGDPVNLSGVTITATIRLAGTEIALTPEITGAASGVFTLSAAAAVTALWSVGLYRGDVQFVDGSETVSTETFLLLVVEDVTGAG